MRGFSRRSGGIIGWAALAHFVVELRAPRLSLAIVFKSNEIGLWVISISQGTTTLRFVGCNNEIAWVKNHLIIVFVLGSSYPFGFLNSIITSPFISTKYYH
jgi:hypothetical protein